MRFQGKIAAWFWGLVIFGSLMLYKTKNPISSTAASLDRIEIVGRRQSIICAVREREAFIQELKRRM